MEITGWEVAVSEPGACAGPAEAAALAWGAAVPERPDDHDVWFRARFAGDGQRLRFGGVATVWEAFLNGEPVAAGDSMFVAHEADVSGRLREENELVIACRALTPLLAVRRKPRARWRTRVVADGNLRFFRTTLLGRAPGFAPVAPPVGPWRPVTLEPGPAYDVTVRARLDGDDGIVTVTGAPAGATFEVGGVSGTVEVRVPGVQRWWPHTHGEPALHEVRVLVDGEVVARRRVGFRSLESPGDLEVDGLDLHVNGERVFARGAIWTPVPEAELRATLERARDCGMNLLRVAGTAIYESAAFHDLCDELGLLVWQDFMFANLDYPISDADFRETVEREARQALGELGHRPSLAVLCGNSEVEQQVAMFGLDPDLGRGELFGELLPALAREAEVDAVYLPSAPCGGELPFRTDRGVANYFGVGAYRRPLDDARRAGVRFASECLAFANVGADASEFGVHHPAWKAGVPRDGGAGWDFDDVRDHYFRELFGLDPLDVRYADHDHYLELSRAVSGEVMAEVFGEWRRAESPCGGGIILWLRDLLAGAGWGVLDHSGRPKPVYHHLRRALAPVAVWTTDEGLNGVAVHVANERPEPLAATLRVALYHDLERPVERAQEEIELAGRSALTRSVEGIIGRFTDVTWAYRFGPPGHDAVVVSLERDGAVLSQAVRFPAGRPLAPEPAERLGLTARLEDGALRVATTRLAYGVRIHADGFDPSDDAFCVEPGHERVIELRPQTPGAAFEGASLTAINLSGRVRVDTAAQ